MTKPTLNAQQLQALIQERLDAIPDLRGQRTDVQDGGIVWKDPGHEGGANWTVRITRDIDTYRPDIARIIRQLQMQYDLDV
jgi:hypothetical protein